MKFRTTLKRIFAATLAFTMAYSLTGCGEQLQLYVRETFPSNFREKVSANQQIADDLYNAGYISDVAYTSIQNQLKAQTSQFLSTSAVGGSTSSDGTSVSVTEETISSLSKGIRKYRLGTRKSSEEADGVVLLSYYIDNEGNQQPGEKSIEELNEFIATNYLVKEKNLSDGASIQGKWYKRNKKKVKPIDLIGVGGRDSLTLDDSDTAIKDFVKSNSYFNLDCKIYVLKPNLGDVNGTNTNANLGVNNSIDKICAAIQQTFVNGTDDTAKTQCLNTYFAVAKKADGTDVTLGDLGFDMLSLIDVSKELEDSELGEQGVYTPGKDLLMEQCGENLIELSFIEFNQDAVDQFKSIIGATQGKFYKLTTGTTTNLVLMEYPVYALSEIKADGVDKTKATINFDRDTGLGINLYTGNIIKYNKAPTGGYTKDGVEYTTIDSYLTVKENSSFAILGSTDMTLSNFEVFEEGKINPNYLTLNSETHIVQNKLYTSGLGDLIVDTTVKVGTEIGKAAVETGKAVGNAAVETGKILGTAVNEAGKTIGEMLGTLDPKLSSGKTLNGTISSTSGALYPTLRGENAPVTPVTSPSGNSSGASTTDIEKAKNTINNAKNTVTNTSAAISSLISGVSSPTSSSVNSSGTVTVKTAKIVLVDYLESTYAKGLVDDESVVNFGRKIRFLIDPKYVKEGINQSLRVKRSADLAYYVDKDGNRYANTDTYYLNATDFCQANLLLDSTPKVAYLSETGLPSTIDAVDSASNNINDLAKGEIGTTGSVNPVLEFPSDSIGKVDVNNTNANQLFYCVTTKQGLFGQYSIYTTWLTSKSPTASIEWWNKYLSDNGFAYQVGTSAVSEYLNNNFSFELQKEGVVILDPNTIRFIQDEMQSEHNAKTYATVKTWFIILGVFLIIYAILLVLAWAIDTNADIGIDLLNKMTLGSLIAAKHTEEIPKNSKIKTKFVDGRGILKIFFIVVVVAVILLTVNIPGLIVVIIKMFGGIAKIVENIVYGLN